MRARRSSVSPVAGGYTGGYKAVSVLAVAATIAASLLLTGATAEAAPNHPLKSHACDGCPEIFAVFADTTGQVQSAPADKTLDASNPFFADDLGTNGQACYDCHQPRQGFTILVPSIKSTFDQSAGLDSIFSNGDTASRADADVSTIDARRTTFALFLNLGIVRIGKSQAAGDFTVAPQTTSTFGIEPKPSCATNDPIQTTDCDPQGLKGPPTLSLFRRPLVNTNVFFDSAVLWDGRASIDNMDGQVKRAAQTLLFSETCDAVTSPTPCKPTITPTQEHDIARFMTGVFTSQVSDNASGSLIGRGAGGGVANLVALSKDPHQPCRSASGSLTVFTPSTCTPAASPVMTLFNAWAGLPDSGTNAGRAAVARGQALFNGGAVLHGVPGVTSCSSCHALNNLGNNPSDTAPASFVRLGLDSPDFLAQLAADDSRLSSFVMRTSGLPVYGITPNTGTTCPSLKDPVTGNVIPNTNQQTTDPGHAMVSGKCADLGKFKPPLLRDLAVREPYFHNGAAANLNDVVNFYNARFGIGLTTQQHSDLVAFLQTL